LIEHANDTIDRLPGIDRVQCGQHEVTGFRRRHTDFDCFAITHFTDEDDLRSLT
jgi:hypothetical protein